MVVQMVDEMDSLRVEKKVVCLVYQRAVRLADWLVDQMVDSMVR
jgi:hypothetical protein